MSNTKSAIDFNQIIQNDRQRRKNEELASQIFGKGRRSTASGAGAGVSKPVRPSLADRISSRSSSKSRAPSTILNPTAFKAGRGPPRRSPLPAGNVNSEWTHDLHEFNNGSGVPPAPRVNKSSRPASVPVSTSNGQATASTSITQPSSNRVKSNGMTIRGLAGPYTVVAENFAPGTTAADIESAMSPIGGTVLDCKMVAVRPITAEITFESKEGADNVIAQFHNQTADGLLLSLYHKGAAIKPMITAVIVQPLQPEPVQNVPSGPRNDSAPRGHDRSNGMDRYQPPRERSRERRRYDDRDEVMDGTYGFDDRMDTDEVDNGPSRNRNQGLYSDNLAGSSGWRGRGNGRQDYRGRGGRDRSRDGRAGEDRHGRFGR